MEDANTNDATNTNQLLALRQQQANTAQINELLAASQDAMICGPTCQKNKESMKLKQQYDDAELNLRTAPAQVEESRRNFLVYSEGTHGYDSIKRDDLTIEADEIANELTDVLEKDVRSAIASADYYNTAVINSDATKELYNTYVEQNEELLLKIGNRQGDILTNDRKTYYEETASDALYNWYMVWIVVFYILLIVFVATNIRIATTGLIVLWIILALFPIIGPTIINWIAASVESVYKMRPIDVYNNL